MFAHENEAMTVFGFILVSSYALVYCAERADTSRTSMISCSTGLLNAYARGLTLSNFLLVSAHFDADDVVYTHRLRVIVLLLHLSVRLEVHSHAVLHTS